MGPDALDVYGIEMHNFYASGVLRLKCTTVDLIGSWNPIVDEGSNLPSLLS